MAGVLATVHNVTATLVVVVAIIIRVLVGPQGESSVSRVEAVMMVEVVATAEMSATHKSTAGADCNRATRRDRCRAEAGPSADNPSATEGASAHDRSATEGAAAANRSSMKGTPAHRRGTKSTAAETTVAANKTSTSAEAAVAATSSANRSTTSSAAAQGRRYIGRKQDHGRRSQQRDYRSAQHVTNPSLIWSLPRSMTCSAQELWKSKIHFERSKLIWLKDWRPIPPAANARSFAFNLLVGASTATGPSSAPFFVPFSSNLRPILVRPAREDAVLSQPNGYEVRCVGRVRRSLLIADDDRRRASFR